MYEVGEYIVHPGQGVCRVDEVVDSPQQTYMLMPVGVRHPIRISFPVSSESRLRPVVSSEEAQALINDYADLRIIEYQGRAGALEEEFFRGEIKNGTCRDTVAVVKTFRERMKIADTDDGRETASRIEDLELLLEAYRTGAVKGKG